MMLGCLINCNDAWVLIDFNDAWVCLIDFDADFNAWVFNKF